MGVVSAKYRRGDYRRACSICGSFEWMSTLRYIGQNRWACDVDAPGLTAESIARHNAKVRPLVVHPRKHPMPMTQIGEYQAQEALIFRLVLDHALLRTNVSAQGGGTLVLSGQRLGECAIYLSDILREGERPTGWMSQATAAVRALADAILTQQYGTPAGPSPTEATSSVLYGGILDTFDTFSTLCQTSCGVALLRAYALFGDDKYLTAAQAAVTFLRGLQRRDARVAPPWGSYPGGFDQLLSTAKVGSGALTTSGAYALWLLADLAKVDTPGALYGVTSAGGDWASPTAATLAQMGADARAFYAGGRVSGWSIAPTSGTFGPLSPLSATTPREYYRPDQALFYLRTVSTFPESVTGLGFAYALRGLYEYEGYSETVAAVYEWLMSFSSNPAAEYQGAA